VCPKMDEHMDEGGMCPQMDERIWMREGCVPEWMNIYG
jgi:hypothetical protein